MTKRETIKFIVQMIASIATAIVTALGATSCMGMEEKKKPPSRVAFWAWPQPLISDDYAK